MLLFYRILILFVAREAIPFALFLFVFSERLIYYAVELKPHITDIFFALWLYPLAYRLKSEELTPRRLIQAVLIGITGTWADSFLSENNIPAVLTWTTNNFFTFFKDPLGFAFPSLAAVVFVIGSIAVYQRDKSHFFLLIGPLAGAISAGLLHKYPFQGRVILFLSPFAFIFVAEGINFFLQRNKKYWRALGLILVILQKRNDRRAHCG